MVFDRPDYCFDSEHLTGMVPVLDLRPEPLVKNLLTLFGLFSTMVTLINITTINFIVFGERNAQIMTFGQITAEITYQ